LAGPRFVEGISVLDLEGKKNLFAQDRPAFGGAPFRFKIFLSLLHSFCKFHAKFPALGDALFRFKIFPFPLPFLL
jgi:hypothetical protein